MSDLLGSILGSMQKPPTASAKERKKAKAEEELKENQRKQERIVKEKFRKTVESNISNFIRDSSETRKKLKPMTKLERTIVHEMAEEAGLMTQAFGVDECDRYVMLFKKEFPPCDEEIEAYKHGEKWDPLKAQENAKKNEFEVEERLRDEISNPYLNNTPASNYRDKYNHLIGTSAAKEAAKKTEANKSFGMVPSRNKRDQRSIEETLNEIRAKKRQKGDNQTNTDS